MTLADKIRLIDREGWKIADLITQRLETEGITGNVTPAIRAFVRSYVGRFPNWTFSLITLADGSIKAAPATYEGNVE